MNVRPILMFVVLTTACLAQTVVKGHSYRLNANGDYEPLPRVTVVAFREGLAGSTVSDWRGNFTLQVPAGPPFRVVFHGDGRVPELNQLAGKNLAVNVVEVALLTPEEHERLLSRGLPLAEKLQCVLRQLPKEGKEADEIRRMIAKMQRSQ